MFYPAARLFLEGTRSWYWGQRYGRFYEYALLGKRHHGLIPGCRFYLPQLFLGRATIHLGSLYIQEISEEIYPPRSRKSRSPRYREDTQYPPKRSRRTHDFTSQHDVIFNPNHRYTRIRFFPGERITLATHSRLIRTYHVNIWINNLFQHIYRFLSKTTKRE